MAIFAKKTGGTKVGNFLRKTVSAVKAVASSKVGQTIKGAISMTGGLISGVKQAKAATPYIQKYAPVVGKAILNSVTTPLGISGVKQAKSAVNTAMPYNVSRNQALANLAKPALTSSQTTASRNSIQGLFSKTVNDGGATGTTNENIILPKVTAPTNVGDINTMSGVSGSGAGGSGLPGSTMGTNTSGLSVNANSSVAGLNARAEDDRAALIEAEKQRALLAEQNRNAESQNWWQDLMGNKKSSQEMLQETRDNMGVDIKARLQQQAADAAEYNVMATQLGQLEAAKNSQILQTNDFLGSRNFLNNMVGKIERNAAPPIYALNAQMSAKAAFMQAKAQNWAEADKLVAQTVEYAMADQKDYLDMMGKMYGDHQDSLDRINPIYKDAFNKKYDLLTEQYNQGIADKTEMMNLALKYGINVDPKKDTLATVQQRIIRSGGTTAMDLATKTKATAAETAAGITPATYDESYFTDTLDLSTGQLWRLALNLGIPRSKNLTRRDEITQLMNIMPTIIQNLKAAGKTDTEIAEYFTNNSK